MTRLVVLCLLLAATLGLAGGQPAVRDRGPVSVQLLAINDFHGNLEPPTGANGRVKSTPAGGAEYLATHIKQAIAENPNSIVVAAGDLIGAAPLISSLFRNEPTIEAMNAMSLAVASVGNHEFDRGPGELLRLQKGGCHPTEGCTDGAGFRGARFRYLSANVVNDTTHAPLFPATAIRVVGGVKIGFIGETLQGTKRLVAAAATRHLRFLDEASTANAYAARLNRQGVHAIVLLIHEGGRQRPADEDVDGNGCADFSGPIDPIVRKLTPDIKIVLSAHSHRVYNCTIAGHIVTSASSYGRVMTRVNLAIDRASDRIVSASATNEVVTRDVAKDAAQTEIIAKYAALSASVANRIVGSVTSDITQKANAAGESALGDVVADAQLSATSASGAGGAVVAFTNAGGLRADIVASVARPGLQPGQVSFSELFNVQPFGNFLTVVTMTGEMLKRLLEQQFDNPVPGQRYMLQPSNGFTYRYRFSAPAGQHVDPGSIAINGRPVGPADRARVSAVDFLVAGSDGFRAFSEGTERIVGDLDVDALVAYFRTHSPVAPGPQNRIVRSD